MSISGLLSLQTENAAKLEQMRQTVDEKLQTTLETRLGESFRLVSERLEQVHKGLGEMQNLASGVGDLKRVLSNVTTRGAWGEVQLENLLAQILAPEQYERDVATTGTSERVEFAIKLPGKDTEPVWLPVDAKFPMETYQRLALPRPSAAMRKLWRPAPANWKPWCACAKTFSGKVSGAAAHHRFRHPLPRHRGPVRGSPAPSGAGGIAAERFPRGACRPTTFAALLNSLQMGFRTLAIQQRSSEVWKLLGDVKVAVRQVFAGAGNHSQALDQATQTVDDAAIRTRAIEKRLKNVETSDEEETATTLHLIAVNERR